MSSSGSQWRKQLSNKAETWRDRLAQFDALPQLALLGLITGLLAGLVIIAFRLLIDIPLSWLLPEHTENFESLSHWLRFCLPMAGALMLGLLLSRVDTRHQAAGIGHVLDRIHNHQGQLPAGNFLTQFFGGALCLFSGHSVGREGPAVHMGAASGSLLGQWLGLPNNSLRPLAACGVAAAIAACFNTPMAGVIFAMEVVLLEYTITGFLPVIIAAVAGTTLTHLVFGPDITFNPPQSPLRNYWELAFMVLAGLLIAVFAALYIRLHVWSCRVSQGKSLWLRFGLAGLVTGLLAMLTPQIMGVGYDTIEQAFSGELGLQLLWLILVAKLVATGIALGVGIPGGVVGPCLIMGACAGGIVGITVNEQLPHIASDSGFYVILGMGAMMGAVLNAPLSAMVAILELTNNPYLIFPGMLMVASACLTTRWLFRCDGLFQLVLRAQGKYREPALLQQVLSRAGVRSLMEKNLVQVTTEIDSDELAKELHTHPVWLITDEPQLLVSPADAQQYLEQQHAQGKTPEQVNLLEIPARRLDMAEISAQANVFQAWELLNQRQVGALYVRNRQGGIAGIICREQLENFYRV